MWQWNESIEEIGGNNAVLVFVPTCNAFQAVKEKRRDEIMELMNAAKRLGRRAVFLKQIAG